MLKLAGEILEEQLADHTADLYQNIRTGEDFMPWPIEYNGGGPTMVANTLYAMPFFVARPETVDELSINVNTLAAGKNVRIGIYKSNGTNLSPGDRVVDAGVVSVNTTGLKTITGISQAITVPGLYYVVIVSDGIPALRGGNLTFSPLGNLTATGYDLYHRWQVAQAYGALPDPFTGGGAGNAGQAFWVLPNLSSLD